MSETIPSKFLPITPPTVGRHTAPPKVVMPPAELGSPGKAKFLQKDGSASEVSLVKEDSDLSPA